VLFAIVVLVVVRVNILVHFSVFLFSGFLATGKRRGVME